MRNKKPLPAFTFKKFSSQGIVAAFSDRSFNLGFSAGRKIKINRRNFLRPLGINYRNLVAAGQVHGAKIILANESHKGKGAASKKSRLEGVDGFITQEKNLPLSVFTADCLSIFLFDPRNEAIGLVHAGWRGTKKQICAKAVRLMRKKFKTRPADLIVGLGPCIRRCCYEVGKDFQGFFSSGIVRRNNKTYLDLIANNLRRLKKCGVKSKNIEDSKICTVCLNKRFFSFRKEGEKAGRMMSVIMLKGDS
ncbi:MAG: peptidoglycan editing factor PgeF [Candidatus Omnitrophota bacterium]|nr:peptidoglycan editing factor PgeF [Candidatus Omnitrophota bacterium]